MSKEEAELIEAKGRMMYQSPDFCSELDKISELTDRVTRIINMGATHVITALEVIGPKVSSFYRILFFFLKNIKIQFEDVRHKQLILYSGKGINVILIQR